MKAEGRTQKSEASETSSFIPLPSDFPGLYRFANTEQAEACGRTMSLPAFPGLVREYFKAQRALRESQDEIAMYGGGGPRMDRCVVLITRQQLLREAIEEFLSSFIPLPSAFSSAGCGAQANPAMPEINARSGPASADDQLRSVPVHASPAEDLPSSLVTRHLSLPEEIGCS